MIILGIDTAIRCTGYGVIDITPNGVVNIIDCGIIKNKQKAPHSECLRRLYAGVAELATTYSPNVAAIESAFYHKNVSTAMILSYARGSIMTALVNNQIPVYAYAPKKAKKAIVGNGSASKEQVATMISSLYSIKLENIPLDATDALAIALCHGQLAILPNSEMFLDKPL
jgi:crossover junction endodeoxyribonuclease RuvC